MLTSFKTAALAAGLAAFLSVSVSQPAHATHQWGHLAAGVGIGLLLGGAAAANRGYYATQQTYVAPAPVYVQPTCYWETQKYYDNYYGWRYRKVQICQ